MHAVTANHVSRTWVTCSSKWMSVFHTVMYMCTRILSCASVYMFCGPDQTANNFNELDKLSISELLQYRQHALKHRWKVEGDQGLGHNPGAQAGLGVGAGGGRPLPLWGPGYHPGKFFWKLKMLNPAYWWLLRSLVGSLGRVYLGRAFLSLSFLLSAMYFPFFS